MANGHVMAQGTPEEVMTPGLLNSIQRGSGNTPRAGIWQADVPNEVDSAGRKNQTTTE